LYTPDEPASTDSEAGVNASEKLGVTGLTVRPVVTECLSFPLTPLTVIVYGPKTVVLVVGTLRVTTVVVWVTVLSTREVPMGPPEVVKLTGLLTPLKPLSDVTVTVYDGVAPRWTDWLVGEIAIAKSEGDCAASTLIVPAATATAMNTPMIVRTTRLTVVVDLIGDS